jgi:gamma-glutamylcyclotransferase (GGCT)/AIG2-like uncharacterized protein YtfP
MQQLTAIDEYEECAEPLTTHPEYKRQLIQVILATGVPYLAWAYIYNRTSDGLTLIESGDFLE